MEVVTQPTTDEYQLVTADGELTEEAEILWGELSTEIKMELYKWMKLIRLFDRRSVLLQRQGRIGTYAPLEGQEAAQVGSAIHLQKSDWIFPSYREHGVQMVAGMPLSRIFLYWMGRVEGCKAPDGVRLLPPYVPIATQIPHAVGASWGSKLKKESSISIAYFGDGATSEGDFHEACNFAGVFQLPVIFFCQNNGYAISVPFSRQSATKTVSEKAMAYNFKGVRVDGNDVLSIYKVMRDAILKARAGGGPTLIEAVTYRSGSHTTADNQVRYRSEEEVTSWTEKDPLLRYEKLLKRENILDEWEEKKWEEACHEKITAALEEAESTPSSPSTHLFQHVFNDMPPCLQHQQDACKEGRI